MINEARSSSQRTDLTGSVFGRWTVIGDCIQTSRGERKWFCRCECGTERYVLERGLKSGGSKSCGCLRKERIDEVRSHDLNGKIFGDLTVLKQDESKPKGFGVWWLCRCSCGNIYSVQASVLVQGKRTHCGCKTQKKTSAKDITGQQFARLTALYPTEARDAKGFVIWRCRCECGAEIDVSYNTLLYSLVKSCGCQKKEHDRKLSSFLTRVDGTSVDMLKSKKIPVSNTTGVRGVYYFRGKYMAKIVFQKKQYHLGTYESLEEAAEVRKEAELQLNDVVVSYYELWKKKPKWIRHGQRKIPCAFW